MLTSPRYFRSEVPAGKSGDWTIDKITVPDRAYDPAADPRPDCFKFRPGTYTCLSRGSTQFMTDLYDEWWTQRPAIAEAAARGGNILITGLGLGLVVEAILQEESSNVTGITVVEFAADVIQMLAPFLHGRYPGKLCIVQGDAFTWTPAAGERFSVAWHDIWPDPNGREVDADMERLERRYAPWCDWQGFWPKTYREALAATA